MIPIWLAHRQLIVSKQEPYYGIRYTYTGNHKNVVDKETRTQTIDLLSSGTFTLLSDPVTVSIAAQGARGGNGGSVTVYEGTKIHLASGGAGGYGYVKKNTSYELLNTTEYIIEIGSRTNGNSINRMLSGSVSTTFTGGTATVGDATIAFGLTANGGNPGTPGSITVSTTGGSSSATGETTYTYTVTVKNGTDGSGSTEAAQINANSFSGLVRIIYQWSE